MFFPSGLNFLPIPTRFPRAWYIESTEKVEKRDFRAVSNGYKPPQDFYDFMAFLWFRLWKWFLMRWYITDCNQNMPKARALKKSCFLRPKRKMLTIYNFSFHKSPQQGYDRQKKNGKTTISPLLTFNLKVGFTFSVLSPKACPYVMMKSQI